MTGWGSVRDQEWITDADEFMQFNEVRLGRRPQTGRVYLDAIAKLCAWAEKPPAEISPQDCEQFLLYMKAAGLSINTQRVRLTGIREFMHYLRMTTGKHNPMDGIAIPTEVVVDPRVITPDEFVQLVLTAATPPSNKGALEIRHKLARRNAALICLLAETGIRESEVARLCMGNVVREPDYFRLIVPGGDAGLKSLPRTVPFTKLLQRSLVAEYWTRWYMERIYQDKAGGDAPLFPVTRGGRFLKDEKNMSTSNIKDTVTRIAQRIFPGRSIYPHLLRHYYGTYSVHNGINLPLLAQRMGHKSITTTMRYVHIVDTQVKPDLEHGPNTGLLAPDTDSGFVRILKGLPQGQP